MAWSLFSYTQVASNIRFLYSRRIRTYSNAVSHSIIVPSHPQRFVPVDRQELRALLWSFLYFFTLLASYYVLRPVRDEMGVQAGAQNLPWLFSAVFVSMLVLVPLFGWIAGRLPVRRLIPTIYLFSRAICFCFSSP